MASSRSASRRFGIMLVGILVGAGAARMTWTRSTPKPNVILIILDAAAARYFGAYGHTLPTTPKIDAFAESSTLFERAYSQAPATIMSVGSLMSGKYPPTHFDPKHPFDLTNEETLAIMLETAGYRTAAFSQNPWISPTFGFGEGFQDFYRDRGRSAKKRKGSLTGDIANTPIVREVGNWLDSIDAGPFFLYVHLLPPHTPYTPPAPFRGRFAPDEDGAIAGTHGEVFELVNGTTDYTEQDVEHLRLKYQENLAYGDAQVGLLLGKLEDMDLLDNSVVIFTSDHGEGFNEHGHLSHGTTLYDEMLHVPLAIRWPKSLGEFPARWAEATELRRLFATIADLVGLRGGNPEDSLLPMLRGDQPRDGRLVRSDVYTPFTRQYLRSVIVWPYKLIRTDTGEIEVYDLQNDSGETHNLADAMPEVVAELRVELEKDRPEVGLGEKVDLGEGAREKLRALGYDVE